MTLSASRHTLFSFHTRLHHLLPTSMYLRFNFHRRMQEQSRKSSRHSSGSSGDGDPLSLIISHTNSNTLSVPKFRKSSGGSTPIDTGDGGVYIAGKSINCSSNRFIWKVVVSQMLGGLFIYQRSAYDYASNWMIEI